MTKEEIKQRLRLFNEACIDFMIEVNSHKSLVASLSEQERKELKKDEEIFYLNTQITKITTSLSKEIK
jgi:hypothetical protein